MENNEQSDNERNGTIRGYFAFKSKGEWQTYSDGINLLKETQEVTSIELYKIGEPLPKRIII